MKIFKASAGSGKTYRLANTYIDAALAKYDSDPCSYRHILAVTFTNKATAEMKARILKFLDERSKDDPRAGKILLSILHDYSAFSVSTIDRFFQQALKAFSREIGQFADYQIELDRDSLIHEAMDRILDSLTEDRKDLVDWIRNSVSDRLELGSRLNIEAGLYEMGEKLKSSQYKDVLEASGLSSEELYSIDKLAETRKKCRAVIEDFKQRAAKAGIEVKNGEKIPFPKNQKWRGDADLLELYEKYYPAYDTAVIIDNCIFSLGIAGEFFKEFDALLKEKNLMCLDESDDILKRIIAGSDAPFIYEKLGVRFDDFLLDEFQDTSSAQWENFLPLLRESESRAEKNSNLIVGDVKQSIYRWRNSDWRLLAEKVTREFPLAETEEMKDNWRSAPEIVNFNNKFFRFAASETGLDKIYSDVEQNVKSKDEQQGSVELSFCDDQLDCLLKSVRNAVLQGARYGDIAVLVRSNDHGMQIADFLIDNGVPVLSDESLKVKSSVIVRRLVSLMSAVDNPDDKVNTYLATLINKDYPTEYHSLIDLAESLIRTLRDNDRQAFEGSTLYVQAFMDDLRAWVETNGNNLRDFLKHWAETDISIATPENSSSVRILTVHKSKGLEFPYVIFPFAESVKMFRPTERWCRYDGGIYPVKLSGSCEHNAFDKEYRQEWEMQLIDNMNVFYVALTRAEKALHIISKRPSQACMKAVNDGKDYEWKTFSELLYAFCGGLDNFVYGETYDFLRMKRDEAPGAGAFASEYVSFPLGGRLTPSKEASDFFGEEGQAGPEASPRINGIILHGILSKVMKSSDLRGAVDAAVADGLLSAAEAESVYETLECRIGAHPEWFGDSMDVLNETAVISPDGRTYRPDRVVRTGNSVKIIDYKFGREDDSYREQIRCYMNLFRQMGCNDVSGCIWYVRKDKIDYICA